MFAAALCVKAPKLKSTNKRINSGTSVQWNTGSNIKIRQPHTIMWMDLIDVKI